jgi:hypothetical protein
MLTIEQVTPNATKDPREIAGFDRRNNQHDRRSKSIDDNLASS